jgi:hypothetical protein
MKDALNAAYPDAPVADTLAARVAARLERPAKPHRRRSLAPALALAAVAGIGLFTVPRWLPPKPVYALDKISKALQNTKSVHIRVFSGKQLVSEEWHSNNRHRIDHCFSGPCKPYSLTVGTQSYGISDEKDIVVESEIIPYEFSVPTLASALRAQNLSDLPPDWVTFEGVQILGTRTVHVYKITLPEGAYNLGSSVKESSYLRLFVSPETNLPIRLEEHRTQAGHWSSSYKDLEFDIDVPKATFNTNFTGKKLVKSSDYATENFYKEIHKPNIGKRATTSKNGVTVLSFPVMEALGLVVWYTVDDENSLPEIALSGKGNTCPLLAQGVVGDSILTLRERYTIQGKRLRWAYFRQTFVAPMGNGDWQLHFQFPDGNVTVVPEIAGFGSTIPTGDVGDEIGKAFPTLSGERARDRAEYFLDGRWKDDAPLVESVMQSGFDPRDGALLWLKVAIQQDDKWLSSPKHARDWQRMADILDQLKRHDEAKVYRDKADAER